MTRKEKAEMTRLSWKMENGKATPDDIKRYLGLRARMIKEKVECMIASTEEEPKGDQERALN